MKVGIKKSGGKKKMGKEISLIKQFPLIKIYPFIFTCAEKQTDRHTDRRTDGQTDRQTFEEHLIGENKPLGPASPSLTAIIYLYARIPIYLYIFMPPTASSECDFSSGLFSLPV